MRVSQVLKGKGGVPITAGPSERVWAVLRRFHTHGIGTLIVVDDDGKLLGTLGERDIIKGLVTKGKVLLDFTVGDVMATDVPTCTKDDAIGQVEQLITDHRARHIPVVEDDAVIGVISIGDVVKARLEDDELENRILRDMTRGRS
jgi:CBS domain-containing protein